MTLTKTHQTASFLPGPRSAGGNGLPKPDRDALVLGCLNLCRKLARTAAAAVPGADVEDLEGEAFLACAEAASQWNPVGTAKFSTFAQVYIVKRLLGTASDQRYHGRPTRIDDWGLVPDGGPDGRAAGLAVTADDADLLAKLNEPGRSAVRLVAFDRLSPERAADRLGLPVKDVKLILRNSCRELVRLKARDAATPPLFADPVPACEFCAGTGSACDSCHEPARDCLCDSPPSLHPCPDCQQGDES